MLRAAARGIYSCVYFNWNLKPINDIAYLVLLGDAFSNLFVWCKKISKNFVISVKWRKLLVVFSSRNCYQSCDHRHNCKFLYIQCASSFFATRKLIFFRRRSQDVLLVRRARLCFSDASVVAASFVKLSLKKWTKT